MALSTFVGMYLVRTSTIGPIAFLAAFVIVLSQTLIDSVPTTETLTRLVLWLWVVAAFPATLTALVELALGRSPASLALETSERLLDVAERALLEHDPRGISTLSDQALGLVELQRHAQMISARSHGVPLLDQGIIESLIAVVTLLRALPQETPGRGAALACVARPVAAAIFSTAKETTSRRRSAPMRRWRGSPTMPCPSSSPSPTHSASSARTSAVGIVRQASVARESGHACWCRTHGAIPSTPGCVEGHGRRPALVFRLHDARLARIRTSVTTCLFVALGSLGESVHKLTLRIGGALLGALAAGLAIVYLLPEMTDIGQLSCSLRVLRSSVPGCRRAGERLSYLGMQMAFALFLGVLQGYGPTTELTVLRDRVVGILLGNVLIFVIFSVAWPVSALDRARVAVADALRALAELMRESGRPKALARWRAVQSLSEARYLASLAQFEATARHAGEAQ